MHNNKGTELRELSLDETEMVGGGFSWGKVLHGAEHLATDIDKGMVSGAITGAVGGAIAGEGAGGAHVVEEGVTSDPER